MSSEQVSQSPQLPIVDRCQHLLCKGMYLNFGLPEDRRVTGDGNFWCGQTQSIIGPDRDLVGNEECRISGRACYQAP